MLEFIKKIADKSVGQITKKTKKQDNGKEKNIVSESKRKEQEKEKILKNLPPGTVVKKIEINPENTIKFVFYGILIMWVLFTLKSLFAPQNYEQVSFSEAIANIKAGKVEEVTVSDNDLSLKIKNENKTLYTSKEPSMSLVEYLQKEQIDPNSVKIVVDNKQGIKMLGDILTLALTVVLPVALIFWFFRKSTGAGGAGGVFGFGKSTAKLFIKGKQKVTFKDVAGVEEAKKDLEEVVDFLKHPEKYVKMGARAPKGVLLVGPSGVGKTMLAKAVAGEANVPFFSMAGSEFMEMLVGVGASRVRDLFGTAKKAGKAIIFIDEVDAIGRARGGLEGGHGEREQTLNQILVEMDGFEPSTSVVVLAATNRGDLLDPALLRPGRFDRRVVLEMPDLEARKAILAIHAKSKPFVEDIDWESVARRTVGFSGADLENMLNEAAIAAAREGVTKITKAHIDEAALKVKIGPAKKRTQTENDRLMTAYHEAGHALVNYYEGLDPVHRVSIVSRGMALGFTLVPPKMDRVHETKSRLLSQMKMAMGGRAAEQIVFGDITTGASSDIQHVTNIARNMVTEWGMSKLGPMNLGPAYDMSDYGKGYFEPARVSDGMQKVVDDEIRELIETAYMGAVELLKLHREKLDTLAKVLVEKETIDEQEFEELMGK